jgi:hypothetical protein
MVLIKVIKILNIANEIAGYYTKVKAILNGYSSIPVSVKNNIKSKVSGTTKK